MTDLTTEVRTSGDTAIIEMHGDLDGRADAALGAAYLEASTASPSVLVLNFREVGYINSTGIALIVGLLAQARKSATQVRVCELSEHYRHIFEITRLADFMTFFPDERSAVGGGKAAPEPTA